MMWKILGLVVVLCVFHQGFGETGCPAPEDIAPCTCTTAPYAILLCKNLNDNDALTNAFNKSERYSYQEINIENSSMQYLPAEMFKQTEVDTINLKHVTLIDIFDKAPEFLHKLRKLHMEHCKVSRGMIWKILAPLTGLKILEVYYNSIKALGNDFSKYIAPDIEQISFYGTETKTLKPGVFANLTKLTKVDIQGCKLTALTRDIFPRPFNVQSLYFGENQITSIPDDLFKDMPNLRSLSMRKNLISTIPENAFDSRDSFQNIGYMRLDENPLKCDCLMVWFVDFKPSDIQGTCVSPKWMAGKELKDLQRGDFNC